ncbi:MAG: RNA polymerase sigma factor [Myxococcales bacterium]|nr:RNA polymerase sigma factor [Myxococcales bacterium]
MDVVERAAGGERSAQQELLERHHGYVRRMLYRLVGPVPELEDLQQAVMVRVLVGLPRWRRSGALTSWIGGICVNVSKDYLRSRKALPEAEPYLPPMQGGADVHREVEAREQLDRCRRILDRLSPVQRMTFVLRAVGHSVDEIAELMGAARSTTRLRLYYARKAFCRLLAAEPGLAPAEDV